MLKQTLLHTLSYFLTQIGSRFVGLISFPIITRLLSVNDYGVLALINTTLLVLFAIGKSGVPRALIFYRKLEDAKYNKEIVFKSIRIVFIVTLLSIIAFTIFSMVTNFNRYIGYTFYLLIPLAIYRNIFQVYLAELRVLGRINLHNVYTFLYDSGSTVVAIIFLYSLKPIIANLLYGKILYETFFFFIVTFFVLRSLKGSPGNKKIISHLDLIKFGFPLIWLELSSVSLAFSDRYILGYLISHEAVGYYAVGYNISMYIQQLLSVPIVLTAYPLYNQLYNTEGPKATSNYLELIVKHYYGLAIPIYIYITFYSKDIISILASSKYSLSYLIVPYALAGSLINGSVPIISAGLYLIKDTKTIGKYTIICAFINVILNFMLIPWLSQTGAAISTFISFVILFVCIYYKSQKSEVPVKLNITRLFLNLVISSICLLIVQFFPSDNIVYLFCNALIYVVLYGVFYLLSNDDIRKKINFLVRENV